MVAERDPSFVRDVFFLRFVKQLASCSESRDPGRRLHASGPLSSLLLLPDTLALAVNRRRGFDLTFRVCPAAVRAPRGGHAEAGHYVLADELDPDPDPDPGRGRRRCEAVALDVEGFLGHVIGQVEGDGFTIEALIRMTAVVHRAVRPAPQSDPDHERYRALASRWIQAGNRLPTKQLAAAGRITARALKPLADAIEAEWPPPATD
jgi:hypothetical protein